MRKICNGTVQSDESSSKLRILQNLLKEIRSSSPGEKVVIVSNFTTVLDGVQKMVNGQGWITLRLDGSTKQELRQGLVDRFSSNTDPAFIFLLSSKAGGMGLNLQRASRLFMMDPDWNPATDLQAMARICRQGQTRNCFIYRFVCVSTVEEAILHRQYYKRNIADSLLGSTSSSSSSSLAIESTRWISDDDIENTVNDATNTTANASQTDYGFKDTKGVVKSRPKSKPKNATTAFHQQQLTQHPEWKDMTIGNLRQLLMGPPVSQHQGIPALLSSVDPILKRVLSSSMDTFSYAYITK